MRPFWLCLNPCALLLLATLTSGAPASTPAELTTAGEKAAGWRPLFDGQSLAGWRLYGKPAGTTIGPGWRVENGILK